MRKNMKVLIAYDGLHPVEYFIHDLKRAGLPEKTEVRVFTVMESYIPPAKTYAGPAGPDSSLAYVKAIYKKAEARNKTKLHQAKKMAHQAAKTIQASFRGWSVKSEVCAGLPSSAIVQKADEWKPDLIVTGSHGASAAARFFLGSVAHSVLIHSRCSVRIVRKPSRNKESLRLIVGMDGSPDSQRAVRTVSERVWPRGTCVRLVTGFDQDMACVMAFHRLPVSKKLRPGEQGEKAWVRRVTAPYVEKLENSGLRVSDIIRAGKPWKVLAGEAEKWNADCVFVGARGLGRFSRFLLGSVSSAVASRARCSVEIVRTSKE